MADAPFEIRDDDRYARFRLISWWRQERLAAARVFVVGAGALGNEVLKNLALLGVGRVILVDLDRIDTTNLTRSILFRAGDAGRSKAEAAAEAIREVNPDVRVQAIHGNVITGVGLGVFQEADVVIGCLDNREARLWINRQCWKAGTPWIDGAIQEISGVCKVFVPPDSACYECGMTSADYRMLNLRYSCPLLRREDVQEGKVPTAPTIASIAAGWQVQEALKLLHGLPVDAGGALVYHGETNHCYKTAYQRKEDCLSHESWPEPEETSLRAETVTAAELLARDGREGAELVLSRDWLRKVECPACNVHREIGRALMSVGGSEGVCPKCGGIMRTDILHRLAGNDPAAERTLAGLGVPPFDVVQVAVGGDVRFYRLGGDRETVLGDCG